jgi:hypothetical protein
MNVMTETRLMVLGGWVVLYGLTVGIAFGIKALYKRQERQPSAWRAAVD